MINVLFNYVDIIVIVCVAVICLTISIYLFLAYHNNPCGTCSEASRCSKAKKMQPKRVKEYHKCYGKNRIENVFFDFNGTILDDLDLCYQLLLEMLDKENLKRVSMDEYRTLFDFPVKDYYAKVGFDFSKIDYKDISNYFFSNYMERWPKETRIFNDFRKTITKLKKQNIKVFIITASEENLLLKQLDYFNIKDLFDGYVASKDIKGNSKVENAKNFIKENNLNPRKSIMFGDTVHDALVAKEIGIKCVLFSKGHNTKKKLKDTGLLVVNSYKAFYKYIEKNI